jgi:hypothetical protein
MNGMLFVSTQLQIWRRRESCMLWGKSSVFAMKEDICWSVGVTPLILNLGARWAERNKADVFNASEPRKEFYLR